MHRNIRKLIVVVITSLAVLSGAPTVAQQQDVLRVAADASFPPFIYRTLDGELQGFVADLIDAVTQQMGVDYEFVNQQWSGIFAGLYADHYDVIIAPTTVTTERAESMAFTEGYVETALGVVALEGTDLSSLEELGGKVVAVNSGSTADIWATEHAEEFGFTVQRYTRVPDAVQAVQARRVVAAISDLGSVAYIAQQQPNLKVAQTISTGGVFAYAVNPDNIQLRDRLDKAIECVKMSGIIAELHEKWFGAVPADDSVTRTPAPGYGTPGFSFYADTNHDVTCE